MRSNIMNRTLGRKKQILLGFAVVFPLILLIALIKFFAVKAAIAEYANFSPPPEAVTSMTVHAETWKRQHKAVGSLAPFQGAMLGTEIIGRIAKINVESGQEVAKGTVLVELDTTVEEANLREVLARLERAKKKIARYEQLKSSKALSPEALDDAELELHTAAATVDSLRSTISRKNVVAPFSGRVGIRQVNVGQTVVPGASIIPLYSLDPLYVNFTVPQQTISSLRVGGEVRVTVDAFPNITFEGILTAIDPVVSESSRNASVQATIKNPEHKLLPGMFGSVVVDLPDSDTYPIIPISSISYAPYGDSVYVIEQLKDKSAKAYLGVRQQMVQLGETRGDFVQVIKGLKEGDEIATSGVFKLRPNASVIVNNALRPAFSLSPNPSDN